MQPAAFRRGLLLIIYRFFATLRMTQAILKCNNTTTKAILNFGEASYARRLRISRREFTKP